MVRLGQGRQTCPAPLSDPTREASQWHNWSFRAVEAIRAAAEGPFEGPSCDRKLRRVGVPSDGCPGCLEIVQAPRNDFCLHLPCFGRSGSTCDGPSCRTTLE